MTLNVIFFIGVPLLIFVLGAAGSGIVAMIKFSAHLARSQTAAESTAKSNAAILEKLEIYIDKTDEVLSNHGERLAVLEYANRITNRRKAESERSGEPV